MCGSSSGTLRKSCGLSVSKPPRSVLMPRPDDGKPPRRSLQQIAHLISTIPLIAAGVGAWVSTCDHMFTTGSCKRTWRSVGAERLASVLIRNRCSYWMHIDAQLGGHVRCADQARSCCVQRQLARALTCARAARVSASSRPWRTRRCCERCRTSCFGLWPAHGKIGASDPPAVYPSQRPAKCQRRAGSRGASEPQATEPAGHVEGTCFSICSTGWAGVHSDLRSRNPSRMGL